MAAVVIPRASRLTARWVTGIRSLSTAPRSALWMSHGQSEADLRLSGGDFSANNDALMAKVERLASPGSPTQAEFVCEKLQSIREIFVSRGNEHYEEDTTQLQHALQAVSHELSLHNVRLLTMVQATLAEENSAKPELVTAALLHDIGHLVINEADNPEYYKVDFQHEEAGNDYLKDLFPPSVTEPVRLHVQAKRYICSQDLEYHGTLSEASKRSLELQGGLMTETEAAEFISKPFAKEAVLLRQWDDLAKDVTKKTPSLEHFLTEVAKSVKL